MRDVPARSAPVYVHQLQKKATILGSNCFDVSDIIQHSLDFFIDLIIGEQVLLQCSGWARCHAGAAPFTESAIDLGNFVHGVKTESTVRTEGHTGLASGAKIVLDKDRVRLELDK